MADLGPCGQIDFVDNANPRSIMARASTQQPLLGEVEQLVLLAVLRLGD
jgi:hypothetical protein